MNFTDEVSSLQPGINIGSMAILGFVGKGAIGEVYECIDDISGERFAVKVIPKAFAEEGGIEILEKEAEYQDQISHPNIIHIDQVGEEDQFYWLRMEFIEGEALEDGTRLRTLADLVKRANGRLTPEEIVYYFYYALVGLDHAHSIGLCHDNLKPENILLTDDGAKLSDYGTTRLIGHAWDDFHILPEHPRMEPTPFDPLPGFSRALPSLLSTFDFFSPERKSGKPGTPSSDLFSLGMIGMRMLTGRNSVVVELPSDINPELNGAWDEWLVRAIAYDPESRFQSAAEMLKAMPGLDVASNPSEEPFFEGQDTFVEDTDSADAELQPHEKK